MKKREWFLILVGMLLVLSINALADEGPNYEAIAQGHVPPSAVYTNHETDDGAYDYKYWDEATQTMYEVTIDPMSEKVLKIDTDIVNDHGSKIVAITEADAKAKALAEYPDAAIDFTVLDNDDGWYTYKVVFTAADFRGVIKINPETGAILEKELDYVLPAVSAAGDASVTEEQAKTLVLSRVPGGSFTQFKQDRDDGRIVYEGEIVNGTSEYDFEIDAATGRFLEWEQDMVRTAAAATAVPAAQTAPQTTSQDDGLIGTARAKEIALEKAGGGRVTSIKLDRDDGRQVYEGEVITDVYEYEFEIDASTGKIREWDRDRLDDD